jgi:class 3 adenylate cyclase
MSSGMIDLRLKRFASPDQTVELPLLRAQIVELGDFTVGYVVHEPGWSWSEHVRPVVGGEWCQARHVGVLLSGRTGVRFEDGRSYEIAPLEVVDIPPGHDGWVVGDEPAVMIEWSGMHTFVGPALSTGGALATLLFTDLVDSTLTAAKLGDRSWRELLSGHFAAARSALDRFGGREIQTTGDGILATFDGPANALRAAEAIRDAAIHDGLRVRAGVHVGEVQFAGGDVRGVAVHEAARIMAMAAADEILVSEATRALAQPSGFAFDDRGLQRLKGLDGERHLYAYLADRDDGRSRPGRGSAD